MNQFLGLIDYNSVAYSIAILGLTIALGRFLGRIKIAGISFGVTWILFVGLLLSHLGFSTDANTLKFMQEFGLIIFITSIGLQVGPGFFTSFKKGGMTLNLLATAIVFLGVLCTLVIYLITDLPITTMVGILSGAVTNTPGMGAAQQAYTDVTGVNEASDIAMGYAVAYPLGVVGIILSIILIKAVFKIVLDKEREDQHNKNQEKANEARTVAVIVKNPGVFGKELSKIEAFVGKSFVISRLLHDGNIHMPSSKTVLQENDRILVIAEVQDVEAIVAFLGEEVAMDNTEWDKPQGGQHILARRLVITKSALNGKTLSHINLRASCGVTVTKINRAGIDLVAHPSLILQVGDRLNVVGTETAITNAAKLMGNSLNKLREPNLISIFFTIFVGIILGSIPFHFSGIPQPIKLGIAGGPLIISILVGRFGHQLKMVTYTTVSANKMLREIGICLFLACVGLGAGENFVDTVADGGYMWIVYGFLITVIPLLVVGIVGRMVYNLNYFSLMGLMAGSMTDPPALAYSTGIAGNDIPAVSYATVYPLTMFLRVVSAQLLVLFLL